jgi:hypothetical protein
MDFMHLSLSSVMLSHPIIDPIVDPIVDPFPSFGQFWSVV